MTVRAPLWDRVVALYARPGVGSACLALQDSFETDIPLLLSVLCEAAAGARVPPETLRRLQSGGADWRAMTVLPLRRARMAMKGCAWAERDARVPALREQIKRDELQAERIQIDWLERAMADLPRSNAAGPGEGARELAAQVLDLTAPSRAERYPPALLALIEASDASP